MRRYLEGALLCAFENGALFMRDGERFRPVAFHDAPERMANYLR
jgi:hypothetical protein